VPSREFRSTKDVSMTELRLLHEATVGEDEIDHLGHMNVRFYLEKALRATRALTGLYGLAPEACAALGAVLELRDTFTRHYREQLVGDRLTVMGGILGVERDGLRLYHELLNPARGERAATFVHEVKLFERAGRAPFPLPEMVAKKAGDGRVAWPEHGRPRTLDLDRPPPALSVEDARERGLAMRKIRVIREEECDEEGFFPASRYQDLVWGGEPSDPRRAGMPLFELEGGGRFGWATLESRGVLHELPRAGARIQSFGAEVELARKTSCRHHWVFDVERGTLLCTSSIVNLAFDIGARRAIEIPSAVREMLAAQHHPDLR
jgi:acyl-CoA thioester hydrolase